MKGDVQGYSDAWQAIFELVREGHSWSGHERNCVFLNCRGEVESSKGRKVEKSFANISAVSGLDFADDGRAAALTDWDHDGDLDIWLRNRSGPRLRLMINRTAEHGGSRDAAFVALRLRGTLCNRDAIGARVEVIRDEPPAAPLIQTLRAGDGFLSQSSKWLHFGLGAVTRIAAVRVRWPGGATESFAGLQPGRRYVLEEGSGAAVEWTRPSAGGGIRLRASAQMAHKKTSSAQVLLPDRVVLPVLRYAMFDGSARRIEPRDGPILVNFWASWCLPCVAELKGLKANEERLRGAGLAILALCVDGLEEDGATDQADAQRLLEQIEFPFVSAAATAELMDKVDLMVRFLFDRHPAFAVPTSLLIDGQGRLAAIYRGPVEVERLLRDLAALKLPSTDLRRLAAPMPGRRYEPLMAHRLGSLARRFLDRYEEDHLRFLGLAADQADAIVGRLDTTQLPDARRQWIAKVRSDAHY
jgi:thiol-disulfide isomerase/thioredoxin